ncbi:MAG: hypothetical protein JKY15_07775 [Deltaproteobacteria bacterium]|nr:hypothetical protein [Deltaproteobacteria bacterium]
MLITSGNMAEYFREALSNALKSSPANLSDEVQAYLISLLADFTRSENVYAGVNRGEEPILVVLLERAMRSEQPEANRIFRQIGDSTLYLLGFFGEKSKASGVSSGYYISMGEGAYNSLAKNTNQPVYYELSDAFEQLVYLIRQISMQEQKANSSQVLSWIEEYQKSKHPELRALLIQNGVFLDEGDV